ncbi:MAG: hypothetical protein RR090_03005 [Niameybacter sp.]|uniref:hypothetical protein n=1 Tax=Niameybacter sp. TaxID=2033640 RepID=UPI002FCB4A4E
MEKGKEHIKLILLSCLIVATVIQTALLWLGSMSSHNFLKQNIGSEPIIPMNIWVVQAGNNDTGLSNSLAFYLGDTTGNDKKDYKRLTSELGKVVYSYEEEKALEKQEGIPWNKLFSMPSIVFEYEIPLEFEHITGLSKTAGMTQKLDYVFMYSNNKFQKEASLCLINSKEDYFYELTVQGNFQDIEKVYAAVTEADLSKHITAYQPSATIENVQIKGNVFLPTSSQEALVTYPVLEMKNGIATDTGEGQHLLETKVNDFFVSPLIKEKDVYEDGTVVYKEQKKTLVTYNPEGVIEYLNLDPKQAQNVTNLRQGYNKVLSFVQQAESIAKHTADNLYLANIVQEGQKITYYFDLSFNGYRIQLSDALKKKLGITSYLEVVVKGNDFISMKICTLEVYPKWQTESFKSHYLEPMDDMYSLLLEQGIEDLEIDRLELVYLVSDETLPIKLAWGVIYKQRWYYP